MCECECEWGMCVCVGASLFPRPIFFSDGALGLKASGVCILTSTSIIVYSMYIYFN